MPPSNATTPLLDGKPINSPHPNNSDNMESCSLADFEAYFRTHCEIPGLPKFWWRTAIGLPTGLMALVMSLWGTLSATGFAYCLDKTAHTNHTNHSGFDVANPNYFNYSHNTIAAKSSDDISYDYLLIVLTILIILLNISPVLYEQVRKVSKYISYYHRGYDYWATSRPGLKKFNGRAAYANTALSGFAFAMLFAQFLSSDVKKPFPQNERTWDCFKSGWTGLNTEQIFLGGGGVVVAGLLGGTQMHSFFGHRPPPKCLGPKWTAFNYSLFKILMTTFPIVQHFIKSNKAQGITTSEVILYAIKAICALILTAHRYQVYKRTNVLFKEEAELKKMIKAINDALQKHIPVASLDEIIPEALRELQDYYKKIGIAQVTGTSVDQKSCLSMLWVLIWVLLGTGSAAFLNYHSMMAILLQSPINVEKHMTTVKIALGGFNGFYDFGRFYRFLNTQLGTKMDWGKEKASWRKKKAAAEKERSLGVDAPHYDWVVEFISKIDKAFADREKHYSNARLPISPGHNV